MDALPENNPSQSNLNSNSKKTGFYIFLTIIFVILIIVSILFILKKTPFNFLNSKQSEDKKNVVSVSPTIPPIRKVEVLPKDNTSYLSQTTDVELFGVQSTSTYGVVNKIIKDGESYAIQLHSGEKFNALLDYASSSATLIGKAWYEINPQNLVLRSSYNIITKEKLINTLKLGQKVKVTYKKEDYKLNGNVKVSEFVLAE